MARNVLLIVIDDVGAEKLAAFGPSPIAAPVPRLEPILARSVIFTRAYATPICGPARSGIQTGRYGFRTGFGTNIADTDAPPAYRLPDRETLLAERINIGRVGPSYACGAFGKWHLTYNTGDDLHPNRNGYHRFAGCMGNSFGIGNGSGHFNWRRVADGTSSFVSAPPFDVTQWDASVNRRDAVDWIRAQARPWFAYVAFNPPHAPYEVPPFELLSRETRARLGAAGLQPGMALGLEAATAKRVLAYDAALEAVASEVAALIELVEGPETLILVTGDNGTPGEIIQPPYQRMHAKRSIYEQGIRVPFFALGAGVGSPGRTTSALVHAVDHFATVLDATDSGPFLSGGRNDGISYLPVLADDAGATPRAHVFSESFKPNGHGTPSLVLRTLLDANFKLIRINANEEFYDLAADPLELVDLLQAGMTPEQKAVLLDLRVRLDRLIAS